MMILTHRVFLSVSALAFAVGLILSPPASAADCGGNVACSCGDTIIASRTLSPATDPVLFDTTLQPGDTACTGDGLRIAASDIIVNFKGNRIRGDKLGDDVGIRILTGVKNVQILNARIVRFSTGLKTDDTVDDSTLKGLQFQDNNGDAVAITGNGNRVLNIKTTQNDGHGIHVTGHGNVLERNGNQGNGLSGITVIGDHNVLTANRANNNSAGMQVTGTDNSLGKNLAQHNDDDGILVEGGGNHDAGRNKARNNGGVQCVIDTTLCQ